MHLVNVMEQLIINIVEDMIAEGKMCTCARCKLDVAAIALNNLPPVYVVTTEGESIKSNMSQYRVDALRMVSRAMEVVRKLPHHQ
ncbi:MAG: late competence development ComFB family protein [Firmicutes bacterium]|nr:late competence development ComFB family protein [Bacillota bacterium]